MTKFWTKKFKNIIFTGLPGVGKTSFGKIYAQHSERLFLDFDHFIEATLKKTIPQIFAEKGEDEFRLIEDKLLTRLERRHTHVFAMGGGTLTRPKNFILARKIGLIILLKAPTDVLARRIFPTKETRPLFSACQTLEDVKAVLDKLWEERAEIYEKADLIVDTNYNSFDTLKLHIEQIERNASNRNYMHEINQIMRSEPALSFEISKK